MPLKEFRANLIPQVKELNVFVKRNLLSTALAGELASALKGRGVEFEDFRDYTPEDDASRIDWMASKKAQRTLIREYKIDVNFNVFFLIDTSESMLYGSTKKLKCEYTAEVVTSMFFGILQTGNSIGFGLFNEKLVKIAKPLMGKKQFYLFSKEISNPNNYGGKKQMAKIMQQTLSILDKKALIILVSDFIGLSENWVEFIKIMAERHEILGIMIRDPRDLIIPKDSGQLVLEDPFSDEKIYLDAKQYYYLYETHNKKEVQLIRSVFQQTKSNLLELTTDVHFLNPMLTFFRKRGARWR